MKNLENLFNPDNFKKENAGYMNDLYQRDTKENVDAVIDNYVPKAGKIARTFVICVNILLYAALLLSFDKSIGASMAENLRNMFFFFFGIESVTMILKYINIKGKLAKSILLAASFLNLFLLKGIGADNYFMLGEIIFVSAISNLVDDFKFKFNFKKKI